LLAGLGLSLLNGLNGWFRIDRGDPRGQVIWHVLGPVHLLGLLALLAWMLFRPLPREYRGNLHPHAYGLMWLVLIVQNAVAQLVTGPRRSGRKWRSAFTTSCCSRSPGSLFSISLPGRCVSPQKATVFDSRPRRPSHACGLAVLYCLAFRGAEDPIPDQGRGRGTVRERSTSGLPRAALTSGWATSRGAAW
jgi:hypothetical protein